jgi:hypothetical protein
MALIGWLARWGSLWAVAMATSGGGAELGGGEALWRTTAAASCRPGLVSGPVRGAAHEAARGVVLAIIKTCKRGEKNGQQRRASYLIRTADYNYGDDQLLLVAEVGRVHRVELSRAGPSESSFAAAVRY